MNRILVADKLAGEALDRLSSADGVEIEVRTGLTPAALADAVGAFDGMIIRSGVQVTAECFARPGRMRAIARAGVGVDNIDLDAATRAGVLVMNTPDANTISTAEHTLAMLLALMRHIPAAHAHVASGQWNRSTFVGRQLAGKTLGVVGLGRVGRAVAVRALACDMRVIGYDPLVGSGAVLDGAVRLVNDLDEMLAASDCVTLHAKITENTKGMINAERIGRMKRSAVVVNCARGELIDEAALAAALNEGRLAGAAIDVYSAEPPKGNPLLSAKNIVLSPHLGASTEEAQVAVSVEAADALLDYLVRGEIRSAVNVVGLPAQFNERDRSYLDLCMRMGAILSPWCAKGIERLQVTTRGEGIDQLCRTLARQCSVALLTPHLGVRLNLVNAASITRERGIQVDAVAHAATRNYAETVTLTIETREGRHEIEGTVFVDGRPRVLAIDGYRMEMSPERTLVLIFNDDRPGVIGSVGQLFGDAGINIADMTLSRRDRTALMLLKLDQAPGDAVLKQLVALDAILSVQSVLLAPLAQTDDRK